MALVIFCGIDPGHHGAVALIDSEGNLIDVWDTPLIGKEYDLRGMSELIRDHLPNGCAIEEQHAMPKQGVTSTFETGFGYGLWRAFLIAYGVKHDVVRAQDWKKALGIPTGADKSASVAAAQRLFPGGDFAGPRGGAKDGRAEACLIAEWKRRQG